MRTSIILPKVLLLLSFCVCSLQAADLGSKVELKSEGKVEDAQAQLHLNLNYLTEQLPPYNYIEDGQYKGISIELLHHVWQRMNMPKQEISMLPWDRAYYLLQQQPNTVLFMTMKTPHRSPLFKWACPIYHSKLYFIAKSESDYQLENFTQVLKYRVAATKAAVGDQLLINKGFPIDNIMVTDELEHGLKLLSRERVDFVISEMEAVEIAARRLGLDESSFSPRFLLSDVQGCFAFNNSVPDEFVQEFKRHLLAITQSPLYEEILERYHLKAE